MVNICMHKKCDVPRSKTLQEIFPGTNFLHLLQLSNEDREKDIKIMLDRSPPPIERHLENSENLDPEWPTLLTVSNAQIYFILRF